MTDLKLQLLDELCDKLDDSGIDGNVIVRDSKGRPYVNIWYGSYEDRDKQSGEMFTVVVTDDSLYSDCRGCYEIKPPNKYCNLFKDTFVSYKSIRAGFYVMGSNKIICVIKCLFDKEKMKETNMANWEIEKRVLKSAAESINSRIGSCFSFTAEMAKIESTQEPLILVRGGDRDFNISLFDIFYDSEHKIYSVVPHGTLGCIADRANYFRNSIHNGFGFSGVPCLFLKDIYNKWKQSIKIDTTVREDPFAKIKSLLDKEHMEYVIHRGYITVFNKSEAVCTITAYPETSDVNKFTATWDERYKKNPCKISIDQTHASPDGIIGFIKEHIKVANSKTEDRIERIPDMNALQTTRAVDVIFNDPATIIIWSDGTKTIVKAENEPFDPEKGLAMAISKKVLGNKYDYYEVFKRYVGRYNKQKAKKERAAQARANKNVKPTDSNKDKKQKLDNERGEQNE